MKHDFEAGPTPLRLDLLVGERLQLSRAKVKALFEAGAIRVEGRRARKGQLTAPGQRVEVHLDEAGAALVADAAMELKVLWEDQSMVFVDKPPGVPSQPLKPGETNTVANALLARYPAMAGIGDDEREAGLVHRLDVDTSGVLLAAKSRDAWVSLRVELGGTSSLTDKRYLALVTGPLADQGEIDLTLAHSGDHVRADLSGGGRPARSSFEVLDRRGDFALVLVRIYTGVLHQVRAHLAAVGAPIYGDVLYGGRPAPELQRFFLHAASLTVPHPTTRRLVSVESPLPPALVAARDAHLLR